MEPIKTIRTVLDVIEEVKRIRFIVKFNPMSKSHLRADLYHTVLCMIARQCTDKKCQDLAIEALDADYLDLEDKHAPS